MSVNVDKAVAPTIRIQLGCNVAENDYIEFVPCTSPRRPDRIIVTARKDHMITGNLLIHVEDLSVLAEALTALAEQLSDEPH